MSEITLEPERYYTPEQVAQAVHVAPDKRVNRKLDRLGIPYVPMGRARIYKGADVLAYLDGRRVRRIA